MAYGDAAVSDGLSVYVLRLLTYGATATSGILVCELGRRLYDQTAGMAASLMFLTGMYLPHFVGFYFLTEQWAILTTVAATVL